MCFQESALSPCLALIFFVAGLQAQAPFPSPGRSRPSAKGLATPRADYVGHEAFRRRPNLSPQRLEALSRAARRTHLPTPPFSDRASEPQALVRPASSPTFPSPAALSAQQSDTPLAAADFAFYTNQDLGDGAPESLTSVVNEPSAANIGDVVFQSGNWYAALSTDGGQSFTFVNPFTGPFPAVNRGFCCDQIVLADPGHGAIFYLQQYIEDGTTGTQRINVDQNADGTFDCAYDFTPHSYGFPSFPTGHWLDFPDLVLGPNFLYHTSNIFTTGTPVFAGAVIARYPLETISSCGLLNFDWFVATDRGSFRATHGAGTTMHWASHNLLSSIRIYRWEEDSSTVLWEDRAIGPSNGGQGTCPGPDGRDWCGRADRRVLGAWLANGLIGFMWNDAQGGGFPYPYIRVVRLNESDRTVFDEQQIWNSEFAMQYPSVGVNARGHIAGTLLWGGGDFFPNCSAWISDDLNGEVLAPLESYDAVISDSGPLENRSGDYLSSRPHAPHSNTWAGTCFSLQGGGFDSNARPRFLHFGRERDRPGAVNQPPSAVSVTPSSSSSSFETLSFLFSDPDGFTDLPWVQTLINGPLNGANACYTHYDRSSGKAWLLNDSATAWHGPLSLGASGILENSQCVIYGAASSASASGTDLVLNLATALKLPFVGAQNIYMRTQDSAEQATGWQLRGDWTGTDAPAAVLVTPSSAVNSIEAFSFVYADPNGFTDLPWVQTVINSSLSGLDACYVHYDRARNAIWLLNDSATAWLGPVTPGGDSVENSQCIVNGGASSVEGSDNDLTLTLSLTAKEAFEGLQGIWMQTKDSTGQATGWQSRGEWTAPAAP